MESETPQAVTELPPGTKMVTLLEMGTLTVRPDDVILFRVKQGGIQLPSLLRSLREGCKENFPRNQFVILVGDIEVGVLRKE